MLLLMRMTPQSSSKMQCQLSKSRQRRDKMWLWWKPGLRSSGLEQIKKYELRPERKCPIAQIISRSFRNYIEICWKASSHAFWSGARGRGPGWGGSAGDSQTKIRDKEPNLRCSGLWRLRCGVARVLWAENWDGTVDIGGGNANLSWILRTHKHLEHELINTMTIGRWKEWELTSETDRRIP